MPNAPITNQGQELSRRRLLALAGGAFAAAASLERADVASGAAGRALAGTRKRGGTLVYGVESNPSGFDPARWWNSLSWNGTLAVFDRLLTITPGGGLRPELLASMPRVSRGGRLYSFTLRPGVEFHHGRALAADDVKFTLERLLDPETASEGASLYTGLTIPGIDRLLAKKAKTLPGIEVTGPRTFTIELEQPDSVILYLLGLPFTGVVPRDVVERLGNKKFNFAPVGTGPFRMTEVDPSRGLTLVRNPAYWRPGVPYADRVEWKIGIAPELSILRIERGQQDLMDESVPAGALDGLRANPKYRNQLRIGTYNDVFYVTLSLKHPALAKLRVRQAIAMGIDKHRLARIIKGLGEPANGGLFSPLSPYYQPSLGYRFDPRKAKQLLAEAGFAKGFDVTFWGTDFFPYGELQQAVQQDLASLGIRVDLKAQVREAWLAEVVKNPPGLTSNEWELPYPHGSYVMDGAFTKAALKSGCCNFSAYVSPRFDKLAQAAHRTTKEAEIVRLYKEMDRIAVRDEALWVPLFYPKRAEFVSSRVRGYTIPSTPSGGVLFFSDYWIA